MIYLKITESEKTLRLRIAALNRISPTNTSGVARSKVVDDNEAFDGDDVEQPAAPVVDVHKNTRAFAMGASLADPLTYKDWFQDLSQEVIDLIMKDFTPKQRTQVLAFARRIPYGLLLMTGSGKTTALVNFVRLRLKRGNKIGGFASANSAVSNYCNRFLEQLELREPESQYLIFRLWSLG
jgi:hypothetical protein